MTDNKATQNLRCDSPQNYCSESRLYFREGSFRLDWLTVIKLEVALISAFMD